MKKGEEFEEQIMRRAAKNHPLKTMIWFLIAGISMLFLTLIAMFGFNHPATVLAGKHFPKAFIISTAIIILGSFTIESAWRAFRRDDGKKLLDFLLLSLVLALGFACAQVYGWMQMWNSDITLFGVSGTTTEIKTPGGAFLYIISGLHLLHLAGGLIFLFMEMFKVVHVRADDVRSVVFFSDKLEKARMEMLSKYWHFLGGLWIVIFLYFLWFFV
ncbi:MAG: hypothetical protein HY064_06410 [Bacteroidetes bacterium]|nr:hypothetical protein [Bacteroidota bacterium]